MKDPDAVAEPGRVILVADVDVAGPELMLELMERATPAGLDVLVVAPAMVDQQHFWASDIDDARDEAEDRANRAVRSLRFMGSHWQSRVGGDDPLLAVADAVRDFPADEIIVVTGGSGGARWIEEGLPGQIAARHAIPVAHFVASEGRGARRVTHRVEPERRPTRWWRWLGLAIALVFAVLGTWGSFLLAGTDLPRWLLVTWVIVLDLGVKIVVLPLVVWWLFFRRPRGDRLDI